MATVSLQQQYLNIVGLVNAANAAVLYREGQQLLGKNQIWPLQLSLAEIEQANTILLAIIIQWLRQTPDSKGLILVSVPDKMLGIIKASHLEHLVLN